MEPHLKQRNWWSQLSGDWTKDAFPFNGRHRIGFQASELSWVLPLPAYSSVRQAATFHSQSRSQLGLYLNVNIILLSRNPAGLLLHEWWCLSLTIPNMLIVPVHVPFDPSFIKTITLDIHFLRDSFLLPLIGGQVLPGAELYLLT